MSFAFLKNFVLAGSTQAADTLTSALVKVSPETATKAELAAMEEDLDNTGRLVIRLQSNLSDEQRQFDAVNLQYSEMIAAAEVLQIRIDDPQLSDAERVLVSSSLDKLLTKIEAFVPELDQSRHDLEATESFLRDAEEAYRNKSQALLTAKQSLEHAKRDMEHAHLEEKRAQKRAEDARVVAGLTSGTLPGLTVALDAMTQSAQESRQRAAASKMKAEVLTTKHTEDDDENIKAAMAEVKGHPSEKTLVDRLSALKR